MVIKGVDDWIKESELSIIFLIVFEINKGASCPFIYFQLPFSRFSYMHSIILYFKWFVLEKRRKLKLNEIGSKHFSSQLYFPVKFAFLNQNEHKR